MLIHYRWLLLPLLCHSALAQRTEIKYLSGTGKNDTLNWEFQCTRQLAVENRYDETNLNQCTFRWNLKRFNGLNPGDTTAVTGTIKAPDIKPQTSEILAISLPTSWKGYDALYITANDPYGREIYTWSWTISLPDQVAKRLIKPSNGTVAAREAGNLLTISVNGVEISLDTKTGLLQGVKNAKTTFSFNNGPILIDEDATFKAIRHYDTLGTHVAEVAYDGKHRFKTVWTMHPTGVLQLSYQYRQGGNRDMLGITFDYPENKLTSVQLLGNGPYRVWRNRLKGVTFGSWAKTYNDAITGERWQYPEFKGYYSNFYGARIQTKEADFAVLSGSEDFFLRLFTPAEPKATPNTNTVPPFPNGGISFMQVSPPLAPSFRNLKTLAHKVKKT